MNTLAVTALAGLDDGVAAPHETLHPFFSSRARARECSALYCELRRVAAIFCNGLNVTERRAPRGVVGLSRGFRCPGVWQYSNVGRSHAIAVGVLHQIHRFIGQVQQAFLRPRIHRERRDAKARRQTNLQAFRLEPRCFTDQLVKPPRHVERVVLGRLRQQQYKLVAPIADGKGRCRHTLPEQRRNFLQGLGAVEMPVRVDDPFEIVDVEKGG